MIGTSCDCLVGALNYLASISWLIDCALAHYYRHDFNENMKTVYSILFTNNDFTHKSYDARTHI